MASPILLDTCALIWLVQAEPLAADSINALQQGGEVFLSPISAWEVGLLVARGRLQLLMSPQSWFARASEAPGVRIAAMSPDLLIASSFLPGKPPRDPADRIIAATARDLGATLMTRDRILLDYGKQGHVNVLKC
ncbi:MAG: type II toxin-antitoxin system VapC family toxin [Afipia sp.]|nr:type II toxin-antitoxin system VapC family toxin [Afipia sp.]